MEEKQWYYVKHNKRQGPISEKQLKDMFVAGELGPETPVWSKGMSDWTSASRVTKFSSAAASFPPPITEYTQKTTVAQNAKSVVDPTVSQVRPWVRYWARAFDYTLFGFILSFVFAFMSPTVLEIGEVGYGFLVLVLWVFVESFFLSTWGATPGKWLLGTSVMKSEGRKLTFAEAIGRSLSVWVLGLGFGIPIVVFITQVIAYEGLKKNGITTWDRKGGYTVQHKKIGVLRAAVTIILLAGFFYLLVLGRIAEASGG